MLVLITLSEGTLPCVLCLIQILNIHQLEKNGQLMLFLAESLTKVTKSCTEGRFPGIRRLLYFYFTTLHTAMLDF